MPKKPICGHPDRRVYSKGRCEACAKVDYARGRQQRLLEQKPQQINKQSEENALLNKIYSIIRIKFLNENKVCAGHGILRCCTKKATEVHHMKGRIRFLLILSKYFKGLCHSCHVHVTEHSAEAQELGLSLPINSHTEYEFTDLEKSLLLKFKVRLPKYIELG